MDVIEVFKNIPLEFSDGKPPNGAHSCWDILHHMFVWQDSIVGVFYGGNADWDQI